MSIISLILSFPTHSELPLVVNAKPAKIKPTKRALGGTKFNFFLTRSENSPVVVGKHTKGGDG